MKLLKRREILEIVEKADYLIGPNYASSRGLRALLNGHAGVLVEDKVLKRLVGRFKCFRGVETVELTLFKANNKLVCGLVCIEFVPTKNRLLGREKLYKYMGKTTTRRSSSMYHELYDYVVDTMKVKSYDSVSRLGDVLNQKDCIVYEGTK